jgi:peroxiredoxin
MDAVLLTSRLLLAIVFAVAAIAKLRDPAGTRATLARFGVPVRVRHSPTRALPAVELAIAVALVPASTAAWGALGAAIALAAFTLVLVRVLARGEDVACNCFGSIGSKPITRQTVLRNAFLLGLAGLVAAAGFDEPSRSPFGWIGELEPAEAAGLGVAAALALACALNLAFSWQLMKQNGRLRAEIEGLRGGGASYRPPGASLGNRAPDFELPALDGGSVSLDCLLAGGRGLTVLFSDPHCSACDPLLPTVGRIQRDPAAAPAVVIVSGDREASRAKAGEHGLDPVLVEEQRVVARAYGVHGMPAVVRVDDEGRIAETSLGAEASANLLAGLESPAGLGAVLKVVSR